MYLSHYFEIALVLISLVKIEGAYQNDSII